MSAILIFLSLLGVAMLLPALSADRRNWLGLRFYAATLFLPVFLYSAVVLLGFSLTVAGWGFLALGLIGLVTASVSGRARLRDLPAQLLHPVFVFPFILLAVAVVTGGIEYQVFPGDETNSWLRLSRQIFLADTFWSEQVVYSHGAYTNGWPLMVAYANIFSDIFEDRHAAVLQFFMHLGLLGFAFDFIRYLAGQVGTEHRNLVLLVAWLVLLGMLLVEASWVLVPTFQGIEKPVLYSLLGAFLLGLAGQFDDFSRLRVAAYLGLAMAAGYLIKVQIITFAPALGIFWLSFLWRDFRAYPPVPGGSALSQLLSAETARRGITYGAAMLVPMAIANLTWALNRNGTECFAAPWEHLKNPQAYVSDYSIRVAELIGLRSAEYMFEFKFALTMGSVLVFLAALSVPRLRWFVLAVVAFTSLYMVSLHSAYFLCYNPFGATGLQSFPRYLRPNFRLLHFFAPLILLYLSVLILRRRSSVVSALNRKPVFYTGGVLAVVLLVFQVVSVRDSLHEMKTRASYGQEMTGNMGRMASESEQLIRTLNRRGIQMAKVSVIAQNDFVVPRSLALYHGIKSTRDDGPYFHYTVTGSSRWSPEGGFMRGKATAGELAETWRGFDILWPVSTDDWIRPILRSVMSREGCDGAPEQYFLFKKPDGLFECVPKAAP